MLFVLSSADTQLPCLFPHAGLSRVKALRCIKGLHRSVKQDAILTAEELLKLILVPTTIRREFGITQLLVIESTLQGTLPGSIQTGEK